ncbi:unnamed protein product, partial [Staurois parvus]
CAVSLGHSGSPINGKSQRCRLGHVISCVQSQLIISLLTGDIYTDHQGTDDHCSPSSATCQCPSMPHTSAYQCTSMPHISAHRSCLSVPPISACQCCLAVLHNSASQCH